MSNSCRTYCLFLTLCGLVIGPVSLGIAASGAQAPAVPTAEGGQDDFDFEFGVWTVQLARLQAPLTGTASDDAWVEYEGTSVVREVWGGQANLGELEVEGPAGRIQGLSLRLYNPQTQEWHISWANSRDGLLGESMVGGFNGEGRGLFYGDETFNGRAIFVRFIFSELTDKTFRLEQSFSADGGETWEPNWIARFRRVLPADARPTGSKS